MTRSGDEAQLMTGVTGDLAGTELGLTPSLTKNAGVPTTDQPQKGKDFTSDQEVRWCPGCGDYVILNTIRNFLPELGLRRENIVFISGIGMLQPVPLLPGNLRLSFDSRPRARDSDRSGAGSRGSVGMGGHRRR